MKSIKLHNGKNIKVLQYTGRDTYKSYVNVGTVGHVDHGKPNHLCITHDWDGHSGYVRGQVIPQHFQPEWIGWNNGLIKVAGHVIYDLTAPISNEPVVPEYDGDSNYKSMQIHY